MDGALVVLLEENAGLQIERGGGTSRLIGAPRDEMIDQQQSQVPQGVRTDNPPSGERR